MIAGWLTRATPCWILVAVLTFFAGVFAVAVTNHAGLALTPEANIGLAPLQVVSIDNQDSKQLAFRSLVIACGSDDSGNPASYTTYEATDGARLETALIYDFPSKSAAQKKFRSLLKEASNIIDQTPDLDFHKRKIAERVVFEKDNEFFVIKLPDNTSDKYFLELIQSPRLEHVLELEKQKKSLANSVYLNQLN